MRKAIFLLFGFSLLFIGCQDTETAKGISQQEAGSFDKTIDDRTIADEILPEEAVPPGIDEKIIRSAYTSIKVSNVAQSYDNTLNLVKKYDVIILNSNISRYTDTDEAQIQVKVKPAYFMSILDELASIGKIESKSISEEDVTEEYYDVKARLNNAHKVQNRLYNILNRANKVEDILKVEKEIERVGEKIEMLEGKIRYFDSMVDYSRISITIYSTKRPFIDFGSISRGFGNAVKYAVHVFFLIIWFIIIIIPLVALVIALRPAVTYIIKKIKRKK